MTQISWFNSFIASICLFLMLSFSTSALLSANSSLRFVDGRMGLLAQPIGESVAWLGDQVKKGIIPFESISVQAQQAVSVVFSVEEILQQLIASVVQSILNTIISLIEQVIDKLKDGIKQIGGVFDKLKEIGAGFINSLQALTSIKDLLPDISNAAARLFPSNSTTGSGVTGATVNNAVYTGLTNFATCQSIRDTQLKLPANERSNVPDQATCDNIKQGTSEVLAKAMCSEPAVPLAGLLGVVNACPTQAATNVDTEATRLAKAATDSTKDKVDTLLAKAPDGCKFAINKESNIFQNASTGSGTSILGNSNISAGSFDFSKSQYSFAAGDSSLGVPNATLTVPSPKECEYWKSGELTTTAAALAADKSVPDVKDGGLTAIFQAFLQKVTQIVTDFINDIVKFAQDLLNQFIGAITSIAGGIPVLGQYLSGITNNLGNVGAGLKNLADTGNFDLGVTSTSTATSGATCGRPQC